VRKQEGIKEDGGFPEKKDKRLDQKNKKVNSEEATEKEKKTTTAGKGKKEKKEIGNLETLKQGERESPGTGREGGG